MTRQGWHGALPHDVVYDSVDRHCLARLPDLLEGRVAHCLPQGCDCFIETWQRKLFPRVAQM